MRYRIFFLLAMLFVSSHLLIAQIKPAIRGIVRDKSTNEVLVGATVVVENSDIALSTNTSGTYQINNLDSGTYRLSASFIGFVSETKIVDMADTIITVNFVLDNVPTTIKEVVVTGTGTEHYIKDAPVQTEVISGTALKNYAGRDIEDVLSGLSSSFTFSSNDMGSNIQLNGLKNDYILILLDGKRINGDVGGQNDLNRINMHNIERIEIVKGAVSSLYGSDAIGGVINFISKKYDDKVGITNTTRVGEYGDINQSNTINLGRGKWNSTTSFALKHTDGWQNTTQEWHRQELINNSVTKTVNRSTNYTVSQNLSYQASKKLLLTADASYYKKWTYRPIGEPQWRYYDFYYRNQTYAIGAKYKLRNKNYLSFDTSFDRYDYFYDYTSREYTDYHDENGDRIVYFKGDRILQTSQRRWLSNLKGVFYLSESNTLSVGTEYIWDKLVSPFRLNGDKAHTYSLSVYAQDEWNVTERLNITAGLRFGHNRDFDNILTPKLSAMYKVGDFNVRGTYSNGFKAPTVKELYYHYYSTIMSKYKAYYGNKDLKPQKSNYYAIAIEYNRSKVKMSLTGYHNQIRNMISLQSATTSYEDKLQLVEETMRYVNLAKGRTYGIDFSFDVDLPANIKIGGSYSYLDAKGQRTDDEKAEDYMQYVNMNATSHHNAAIRASWSHTWTKYRLGINLNGRYQSKRYYISDGNAEGFQIWRLNTNHSLINRSKYKFDLNIGVDNIFDYVDRIPFGRNRSSVSPGRNYYASLSLKFQNKTK